ncbi:pyocin activator PrtN family protein [Pseudoxanthomonas indica]|uniref:Pyocin activator protein PrtN n=1 Tax=Pseudoxanthomonas indica TaxID=428993 RepID=A0A1T5K2B3_9GAMM|nr:pyocin activator PrtN family protein [Pseudoxanthomonas indica]GGD45975.1 hypothetical protein GCM10007235_17470 [Pseudoxanthomonas indica]SKC57628.1 Pyocin activator protein PrtN [Pseudoxanthomonas indica]
MTSRSQKAPALTDQVAQVASSRTLFLLLAEFGSGQIPVERCCHHFGLQAEEAKRAAGRQQLPVPAFRLGSQKSPWLVSAEDLASFIDCRAREAREDWQRLRDAS